MKVIDYLGIFLMLTGFATMFFRKRAKKEGTEYKVPKWATIILIVVGIIISFVGSFFGKIRETKLTAITNEQFWQVLSEQGYVSGSDCSEAAKQIYSDANDVIYYYEASPNREVLLVTYNDDASAKAHVASYYETTKKQFKDMDSGVFVYRNMGAQKYVRNELYTCGYMQLENEMLMVALPTDEEDDFKALLKAYARVSGKNRRNSNSTEPNFVKNIDTDVIKDAEDGKTEVSEVNTASEVTSTPSETAELTANVAAQNGKYSLTVGGVPINSISLPAGATDEYITDNMIQYDMENGNIHVTYSDSHVKVNDEKDINYQKELMEANYDTVEMSLFTYNEQTGYAIAGKDDGMVVVEVYEPVPGASTYLKVRISDFTGTHDATELMNTYSIIL